MPVLPRPALASAKTATKLPNLHAVLPALGGSYCIHLPEDMLDSEMEIRIQVVQGGEVIGESILKKPVPAKGGLGRLSLEWKRG